MAKQQNPALKDVAFLVGSWNMQISNASFLPSLSQTIEAPAAFEWYEGGEFLVLKQGTEKTPRATWLIGRDQDAADYTVLYFDDRQVSRVYQMSFENRVWKIWRNATGFVQKFEATVSADGNTVAGSWGKSADGQTWEHDFDLTYTRKP